MTEAPLKVSRPTTESRETIFEAMQEYLDMTL